MCVNCLGMADVAAVAGSGALVAASSGWQRITDVFSGRTREQRRRAVWDDNAAFLRELGHDPVELLGAPPEVVPPEPAPRELADV